MSEAGIDFQSLLSALEVWREFKAVEADTGIPYRYLCDLRSGRIREPCYSRGKRLVEYYEEIRKNRFSKLDTSCNGWAGLIVDKRQSEGKQD